MVKETLNLKYEQDEKGFKININGTLDSKYKNKDKLIDKQISILHQVIFKLIEIKLKQKEE